MKFEVCHILDITVCFTFVLTKASQTFLIYNGKSGFSVSTGGMCRYGSRSFSVCL